MKILKEILLVVIILAFSAIAYHHLSYPKKLRNAIHREIALNFGVKSTVGTMKMNLFRGEVKIKNASFKNPHEDFGSPFLIEFPGIYIKFSPFGLLFNEIILDEVVLYSPRVYLEYSESQNKTNFDFTYNHVAGHIPSIKSKYFTIRDLEIRDLEILNMQDSLKAHSIGEIIVKNIGAQESGMGYARLACTFLDILYENGLKYYMKSEKDYSINSASQKITRDTAIKSSEKTDFEIIELNEPNHLNHEEDLHSIKLREVKDIINENEKEIKELEGAIGVKPKKDLNYSFPDILNRVGSSLLESYDIEDSDTSEDNATSLQKYGEFFNLEL